MRSLLVYTCSGFFIFPALTINCKRQNYEAHEYHPPLTRPEPVASGEYSDPAAATPEQVAPVNQGKVTNESDGAAPDSLPQGYYHCPPPGTTPPSAPLMNKDSRIEAIDCPPGDPNASSAQTGLPGTQGKETGVPE